MANATDDNSNLVDMDDFNAFENLLFERTTKSDPEPAKKPEVDENDDNSVANENEEDTDGNEDEGESSEDDSSEDEAPEPEAKGKKNRTQERIEKLVAEARVAEREAAALRAELNAMKASKEEKAPEPKPLVDQLSPDSPKPNDLNDKGEPVYPLGEFDPLFIRDLTKFTIEQEYKVAKVQAEKEVQEKAVAQQRNELQRNWNDKVEKVKEDLPDYVESVQELATAFVGVDAQYGDYLATTVMQCDNGPEIMYYLSQNIDEAQKIVASGPLAATLAIGRLQARLEKPEAEAKSNKKVSSAPTPPPTQSRGKGGNFTVRGDTDDLNAFERDFFKT